jgi:hypothetical protein
MSELRVCSWSETPAATSNAGSSPVNIVMVGPFVAARGSIALVATVLATWLPAVSRPTSPAYSAMAVGGCGVCSRRPTYSGAWQWTQVVG